MRALAAQHCERMDGLGYPLELRGEVRAGRLDGEAVEAILRAAGHRARGLCGQPSRLTAREVEVLRLVARGQSSKEVARQLGITPKTAGNHIEHIYAKIGARNRAEAGLFAVQNGLYTVGLPADADAGAAKIDVA